MKADMVATEERKIASRKAAAHDDGQAHGSHIAKRHTDEDGVDLAKASGKAGKDRILRESKSAGKVDYKEAEETERLNQKRQNEKEADAHKHATANSAKVVGRGDIA